MPQVETSIEYLKGVGPQRADLLKTELGIHTFGDLLELFPFRYADRSKFYTLAEIPPDVEYEIQVVVKLLKLEEIKGKGRRLVGTVADATGTAQLVWFQGLKWIKAGLQPGTEYVIFGKPNRYLDKWSFAHPEMERLADHEKSLLTTLQPVYPSTEKLSARGLNTRGITKLMQQLLPQVLPEIRETLSEDLLKKLNLPPRDQAFREIHFPSSAEKLERARFRFKFEEFFFMQLSLLVQKRIHRQRFRSYPFKEVGRYFNTFFNEHLPFELTEAQKRVIREIRGDVAHGHHMNRLLQGDVGSGKTMVALMSMLLALDNGYQACLMAPTEILAQQHHRGVAELLAPLGLPVALLTGSTKKAQRDHILEGLENGSCPMVIGTHALLEERVKFKSLGLAVIDEQHRFGVAQRAELWKKNELPPHILVMTATPIPRTLAMSLYGDLDLSVIDELPPGRKPIQTVHRYEGNRLRVFGFLKEEIAKGRQCYIVYPLIQESEKLDYKDLMDGYESILREFPRPEYQVSVVHGKMKAEDKDFEMARFAEGKTHILVATTVIEVGVNVPNASVMVIESAERFGLSQLHQLRGRVGRGAEQSYCILMTGFKLSREAKVRIETMVRTQDGFEIADTDLQLRGPGDLMGTQQSGELNLKVADLRKDRQILLLARQQAEELLESDPQLTLPGNFPVLNTFNKRHRNKMQWGRIS